MTSFDNNQKSFFRPSLIAASCAVTMCIVSGAHADLVIDSANNEVLDISATVGEGANTSYVIVDFEFTGGDAFAFAYLWDDPLGGATPLTSFDMLLDLALDGPLGVSFTIGEFGPFITNFAFAGQAGDPDNFWSFSLGEVVDPGIEWTGAPFGVIDRELADGSIDGWYNGFTKTFDTIPPNVPTVVIPAPGMLALLGMAGFVCRSRRRALHTTSC